MSDFLEIVNLKRHIQRVLLQRAQLELYYPKNTYDRYARREMKIALKRFNELFYRAYPQLLNNQSDGVIDYQPRTHARQYDVQRAITLCKSQKVRRKDIIKIEENLNLQFIIENQLQFYDNEITKARRTIQRLAEENASSFFPELFVERIQILENLETHYIKETYKLEDERDICIKAIHKLINRNYNIFGQASKYISEIVTESVKSAVDAVSQTFGRLK